MRTFLRRFLATVLALSALPALADRVRVAPHPLVADTLEDDRFTADIADEIRNILVGTSHITPVGKDEVQSSLRGATKRCPSAAEERLKCLEALAFSTGATYALLVEVRRLGSSYELTALLAAANHTALRQPRVVSSTKQELLKALTALLLEELKLKDLAGEPAEMAKLLDAPKLIVPPPPIIPADTGPSPARVAAWVTGGVAVAAGGTALALGLLANADAEALLRAAKARGETGPPYNLAPEDVPIEQARAAKTTATIVLASAAGAAAIASIVLFVASGNAQPSPALTPSAAPVPGGAVLFLSGTF